MKKIVYAIVVIIILVVAINAWFASSKGGQNAEWMLDRISKGNIKTYISASGSLAALTTVQVGSEVSGRILKIFADFNSRVKEGQLIAQLDPSSYEAQVQQATANYENAVATEKNQIAQLKNLEASMLTAAAEIGVSQANVTKAKIAIEDAERNLKRIKKLFERKLVSKADLDTAKTAFDSSKAGHAGAVAQLESSRARKIAIKAQMEAANAQIEGARARVRQMQAQLNIAEINLSRTKIYSPIDGVVISRAVDEGQTVAASLQAPTLFTIAQNMKKMQIETAVDEADIGQVKQGQRVSFTVDAYKNKTFRGKVEQVRLQPIETSNVVTYSVMVNVDNDELLLKPGMTANVEIIVGKAGDVLRIPIRAMYFKLTDKLKSKDMDRNATDTLPVWILENEKPVKKMVRIGLSNDLFIEVKAGEVKEGEKIIVGRKKGKGGSEDRRSGMKIRIGGRR